jgi:hypothetical protein
MTKIGRNDPCPCGSGKKYKKCHPGEYDPDAVLMRGLPEWLLHGCWIAEDYKAEGLSPVFVVRERPDNGRLVIASFMCDIFCLGVKSVIFETNTDQNRLDFMLDMQPQEMMETEYGHARDVILGSVQYAGSLGFSPHAEYAKAAAVIESNKPFKYEKRDFGVNGKPLYYAGPDDNYQVIFETLEQNVGKGKFDYVFDEETGFVYDPLD